MYADLFHIYMYMYTQVLWFQLFVQPVNVTDEHLPVAHTCFNLLDLPVYSSKDQLRSKLIQAIGHCEGFGLV